MENAKKLFYEIEELIPVAASLTEQYTEKKSSSITYEKAEQLMGAVIYCINEVENQQIYEGKNELHFQHLQAREAYQAGYELVLQKVKRALHLYNQIMTTFDACKNIFLKDTLVKGMPEFFRWYDSKFAPQNTILTLDYPVLLDVSKYQGIDAIELYLKCISIEQIFLGHFEKEYVCGILEHYNSDYPNMVDNLCQIVFTAIICHAFIGKSMEEVQFTNREMEALTSMLAKMDTQTIYERIEKVMFQLLLNYEEEQREALQQYLSGSMKNISFRLKNAADNQSLSNVI